MSVQDVALFVKKKQPLISNQQLGSIAMLCSPMLYIASYFYNPTPDASNPNQVFASFFGVLYLLGAMASATAMQNLGVTGSKRGSQILYVVQLTGLFLAMWCDIFEFAAPGLKQSTIFFVTDMAYPFSHLLMFVVGFAVIRAGVWNGWRRIPPFLVALALPTFIILSGLIEREGSSFIFPVLVTIGFFLLGYAVRTSKTIK